MNKSYINWKEWDFKTFGQVSPLEAVYYQNILNLLEFNNHAKALEIGYGNGSFLGFMSRKNFDITGIELNRDLVDLAKKSNFKVYESLKNLASDASFEFIFLFDVLEHIPSNEVEKFLKEIKLYLAGNGRIFLRFPNGASPLGLENQNGDVTHCNVVTIPKLNYWCSNLNLQVTFFRGDIRPFIFRHNLTKMPSRVLRKLLYFFAEKLVRFISIQSRGILSSNLEVIVSKNEN